MTERLILSQHHLYTFQACARRFYLRFLARVPWPEAPLGPEQELAYERGRLFHRWIERYFLGLPFTDQTDTDPILRSWWAAFQQSAPALPEGRRHIETSLTVPIGPEGRHLLTGRFDLLIIGEGKDGQPAAWLFDWKTGEPRSPERLRRAWQTRVYLVLLAEGGTALAPEQSAGFKPNQLAITYWYVEDPEHPRHISYDGATHARFRQDIETIVAEIDRQLTVKAWPLTEDWAECRRCAYQALCGRQAAGRAEPDSFDEKELPEDDGQLEPQWG